MIFMSASIPDPKDVENYFQTADLIAIRDAVRALATVIIPRSHLIWGGHPAITPLIRYVISNMGLNVKDHITIYQSDFFKAEFPTDNQYFENIIFTPKLENKALSLKAMRLRMFNENKFKAGIFIGGMNGVKIEFEMFKEFHPTAKLFPVASTGAAAKDLYDNMLIKPDVRLENDFAYMALFRSLFNSLL
jgi:hypothetical protein